MRSVINPWIYTYSNYKPDFTDVKNEELFKNVDAFKLPNAFEGFVLPKEFAARLCSRLGYQTIEVPYRDVPLTNRNIIESHLFTKCIMLDNSNEIYNELLMAYNSIRVWGELAEKPADYDKFTSFLAPTHLRYFGDRIRYIPTNTVGNLDAETLLKACGISSKELYKHVINVIDSTNNFKYARNTTNFLKSILPPVLDGTDLRFKEWTPRGWARYTNGPGTKNREKIIRLLFSAYFSQYKQWYDDSSWVMVEGDRIYVNHHSVYEIGKFDEYLLNNPDFPNQLPFGIHPSIYFKDRIEKLAIATHKEAAKVTYPEGFKGILDLNGSPHRQLLTGLDLVNEGVYMHHCVGGENYQRAIQRGSQLFFHLSVPGSKYGTTLSMERGSSRKNNHYFNGEWWRVDQYYGFDDSYANDGIAGEVLQEFLGKFFTPYKKHSIKYIVGVNKPNKDCVHVKGWEEKIAHHIELTLLRRASINVAGMNHDYALDPVSDIAHREAIANGRMYQNTWGEGFSPEQAQMTRATVGGLRGADFDGDVQTPWSSIMGHNRVFDEAFFPTRPIDPWLYANRTSSALDYGAMEYVHEFRSLIGEKPFDPLDPKLTTIRPNGTGEVKANVSVSGLVVSTNTTITSVVVPPGGNFSVDLTNTKASVNCLISTNTGNKSTTSQVKLAHGVIFTNTTDKSMLVHISTRIDVSPTKIASTINSIFNPTPTIEGFNYEFYPHRHGIVRHNHQTMGRALRV